MTMNCSHCTFAVFFASLLITHLLLPCCSSLDVITPTRPVRDGDILLSGKKTFALGFFSPGSSRLRYVGIWYNKIPEQTVVWVANRDNPIANKTGVLTVDDRGGLAVYAGDGKSLVWSANVSAPLGTGSVSVARLLDVGNLVLFGDGASESVLWQSFDHPTDTMLPFMTLGLNRKSGLDRFLTSSKSPDDPGRGNCSLRIDPTGFPQLILELNGAPRWRGGPWTGQRWSGVPEMTPNFIFNVSYVDNLDEVSITYGILNESIFSRMVLDESGTVYRTTWHDQVGKWVKFWWAPKDLCDNFRQCGANGYCDPSANANNFECTCLPGFEPRAPRDWFLRDGSGGCLRKRELGCGNGDLDKGGFVKLERVKVPDTSKVRVMEADISLKECEQECRRNCTCTAYARANESAGGFGCVMWFGDMVDTRTFPTVGQDLYVRVDSVTLDEYAAKSNGGISKSGKLGIGLSSLAVLVLALFIGVLCATKKRKVDQQKQRFCTISIDTVSPTFSQDLISRKELGGSTTSSELPFFNVNAVAAATDSFSHCNKLGEGGFGSVYKGVLSDGREIAVKRLSKYSGQGGDEFKNEVLLIANLQHRNLVRILGYCVQGEEKMIIYEYLPNKSLDYFIFDETKRKLLDWGKRFDIICGVARGLLYLHQDSRLRIVHRDLKASNVLLDAGMNPKIADFGMARIFGGDQNEANTNRVVGTYGYMSPEYAMEGRFSIKSDVYSFGVLLLEIVTGRKNTGYFHDNPDSNLVGYVWESWKKGTMLELVDSYLDEPCAGEALRCIQIALLCVQDYADDRPKMSSVVFMLGNTNGTAVPTPKQPAFVFKRSCPTGGQSTSEGADSVNDFTCSIVEAR